MSSPPRSLVAQADLRTCYEAKDGFEFLILSPPSPRSWDHRRGQHSGSLCSGN